MNPVILDVRLDRGGLLPRAPPDHLPRDQAALRAQRAGRRAHASPSCSPSRASSRRPAAARPSPTSPRPVPVAGNAKPLRADRPAELAAAPPARRRRRRSRSRSTTARASRSELAERAERLLFKVAHEEQAEDFHVLKDILSREVDRLEELASGNAEVTGTASGFADLDQITGGFQPGNLIILAARPGMGKSGLVANIAEHVAVKERRPVAFFSLEMSDSELAQRLIAKRARIPSRQAAQGPGRRARVGEGPEGLQRARGQRRCGSTSPRTSACSTCGRRRGACTPRRTPAATAAWR